MGTDHHQPHHQPHPHPPHRHGSVHLDEADWQELAAQTEREGEVLIGFLTGAVERVIELRGPDAPPVRRVLDIGSGPGVGTCELALRFPAAQVIAVDGSPAMLDRTTAHAADAGLGDRVTTHLAELPGGVDGLDPVDVVWASMSLHHVGDETAMLRVLHDLLEPDGVIAIAEHAEPMRVLPDDLDVGRPGLAERLDAAGERWFAAMREGLPDSVPSTDLPSMIASAGFEVLASEIARVRFDAPLSDLARQMVLGHLRRIRRHLDGFLEPDDLAAIEVLGDAEDPRGVMARGDVFVAASREIVIARRPLVR